MATNRGNATPTAPESAAAVAVPVITDDQLEQFGGDVAALDAWEGRGRAARHIPFARHTDYAPGSEGVMPNLNPRGMLVLRHDPAKRFHFAFWDEDGSADSRRMFTIMSRKGCRPATSDDFIVHPDLRATITPDETHRLTFAASKAGVSVVMFQTEEDYRRDRKQLLSASDEIQKTAEEKAATTEEALRRGGLTGVTASSRMEDDWEADDEYRNRS